MKDHSILCLDLNINRECEQKTFLMIQPNKDLPSNKWHNETENGYDHDIEKSITSRSVFE